MTEHLIEIKLVTRIECIERNIKSFLKEKELSTEDRVTTERIVRGIYYIDVKIIDVGVITIEELLMFLSKYKALRTYEIVPGKYILRFVFDFHGVLQ